MSNEAKPRLAPYGLLSPAVNVVDLTEREIDSFEYEVFCGLGATAGVVCSSTDAATISTASGEHFKDYKTVVFEYTLRCSTMGMTPTLLRERLDSQREVQLEQFLGNELWNGTAAQTAAPDFEVNRYLNDENAEVLTTSAVNPDEALGIIEQGLAERGIGGVGVVHVPRLLVSRLDVKEKYKDGVLWTEGGNIVVTSTGYGTNGPEGSEGSWIFGTGLVTVRLGDPVFYDDKAQRFINTQNNTIELVGEQPIAVTWNDCTQVAAQVNVDGIN